MNKKLIALATFSALVLAGCGGGGGDSNNGGNAGSATGNGGGSGGSTSSPAFVTVSGTAATGSPIANASVVAFSTSGQQCGQATTSASGTFTLDVTACGSLPAVLGVLVTAQSSLTNSGSAGGYLTSIWQPGQSVSNITTWTDAIVKAVLGQGDPISISTGLANSAHVAAIKTADSNLANLLAQNGLIFDPITTAFTANGSGFDGVLDISQQVGTGNGTTIIQVNGTTFTVTASGAVTAASITPTGSAYTNLGYFDFNRMGGQTSNAYATDSSSLNIYGGNQTFMLAQSTFYSANPDNLGQNYNWQGTYGQVHFGASPANPYLSQVAMVCAQVPNDGISGSNTSSQGGLTGTFNNIKSTDVLVGSAGATQITMASSLAGVSLFHFYEDCFEGDTIPATINTQSTTYNALTFNADGSATMITTNGGTTPPQSTTLTAAQVTQALNGGVTLANGSSSSGNMVLSLTAYSYVTAYGLKKYAVIQNGAPSPQTTPARGYVGLWTN